jgi:hypothetical protein
VFSEWRDARQRAKKESYPKDLECADIDDLVQWLSLFAAEARNEKGEPYPPSTISNLLAGLLRSMRLTNPAAPNFMDKKDTRF